LGDILPEDLPEGGISVVPDGIWAAGIEDSAYTGGKVTQSFRLYDGKKLLKEKTDYTVSIKNNQNAYTYTDADYAAFEKALSTTGKRTKVGTFDPKKAPQVVIKMKGNYSGTQTVYFQIRQADITGEDFETYSLAATYTGKKQTPVPVLTWQGKALKYGTDFYVPEYEKVKKDKSAFTEAKTYELKLVGKNNFTGEIPITLTISADTKQIAMSKVAVKGISAQEWAGEQIKPSGFTVSYLKDVLSQAVTGENGDYTVSFGKNTAVGTGTVILTGTGKDVDGDGYSYIGTKVVSFKITGTPMSKVTVNGVDASYSYTGSAVEPKAVLSVNSSFSTSSGTLVEGVHYTVSYQKNLDAGTATILFTGLESGGYTGTRKQTFKIVPAQFGTQSAGNATAGKLSVSFKDTENLTNGIYAAPYRKGGAQPEVLVTYGSKLLELGKDYTVSYSNNTRLAGSTDAKAPTVTVNGKGNYTGSKQVTFSIVVNPLSNENGITVAAKDKAESTKPNGYRQSFKVYDADGKALGTGDYDAKNVTYTLIQTKDASGKVVSVNQVLDESATVPANSVIQITVQGQGNYAGGTATGTYRILESGRDISKATIQLNDQSYTGKAVTITEQSQFKTGKVTLKTGNGTKELVLGQDIEVVEGSYVANVKRGTAKVTFRGINDFGGTKTVSFKIGTRSIVDFWKGIYTKITK
jgi:hypothetical protein